MFRQIIRIGRGFVNSASKYGPNIQMPRHFNSAMIANWPDSIKRFLEKEKISQPTIIQEKTLPIVMENKNLVGVARTGSGKTLAFVIPAVMKIFEEQQNQAKPLDGHEEKLPSCLILAPTRELASQTADVFKRFRSMGIRSVVLVGGASRNEQLNQLAYKDHHAYIATPGRLLDLMEANIVDLSQIKYLVLDEADRMLDMGFEPQIRKIIEKIPRDRQTLMWSATWPEEIQSLARDFMPEYEFVGVDSEKLKANPNIKQIVQICEPRNKLHLMLDYLSQFTQLTDRSKILIFVNTKRMADQLQLQLMRNKHRAVTMHGDRSQRQRDDALRSFRNQSSCILVATDVAARGLDINDVTHVINYDFPNTIEDYIHRIGRTARHEKSGVSLTLFTENDANLAGKLLQVLMETNQEIPADLERMQHSKITKPRRPMNRFSSRSLSL